MPALRPARPAIVGIFARRGALVLALARFPEEKCGSCVRKSEREGKIQMRLSNPLVLASFGVLLAAASCTLITDVDRSKIPDGASTGGDGTTPQGGDTSNAGQPNAGGNAGTSGSAGSSGSSSLAGSAGDTGMAGNAGMSPGGAAGNASGGAAGMAAGGAGAGGA